LTSTAGRRPRERSIASSDSRRRTKLQRTPRSPSANITNNNSLNFQFGSAGGATITNNSLLLFTNSGTGGTARLLNAAAGTIDLSGSNGITAGSIEGAGRISLGSNNMAVGGNNLSTTFSGVLKDGGIFFGGTGGSLTKTGAGALTLAGASTYTGVTTVNSGTLSVNGSIANSALTVNAGGTLGGNGTVGNTTINGGTLAPGNSIGLLTVQGSLVFTAASSYMVEVSPANADRTNITGTATLGGATVSARFAAGTYVAKRYTILNAAGGVNGTFTGPVNTNLPGVFTSSLSYDANNAYLNLSLFSVPSGLDSNQQNVANALSNFFDRTGGIPLVFAALSRSALLQASGETATGAQQTTFEA
jgi:autotransporter-associated beta strand protein